MLNVMHLPITVDSVHAIKVVMLMMFMAAGDHDVGGADEDGGRSTLC